MATATAAPPPWLTTAHPEILPVDHAGHTLWPGSRQSWCPSSPIFREHALALVGQMARRYGVHPAVRLWHVSNELGCHNGRCWCDVSAAAFRRWLADRYGDIEKLNDAWGTTFWSQHYARSTRCCRRGSRLRCPTRPNSWTSPASPPTPCWTTTAPTRRLRRTRRARHDELHGRHAPVRTGLLRWAPDCDVVSQDHYLDHRLPHPHAEQAFTDDLTRGLAGGSWLLMESATSAVNWQPVNVAEAAGRAARGLAAPRRARADGVGFFQWRASRAGGEVHSALVPHAGPDSARFREVVALGAALKAIGEVAGAPVAADVALLWDWNAWWACDLDSHPSSALRYVDAPHRWHRAFTELGATVDVVHPSADLSAYRLVIVPTLYLCSDALAASSRTGTCSSPTSPASSTSTTTSGSAATPARSALLGVRWRSSRRCGRCHARGRARADLWSGSADRHRRRSRCVTRGRHARRHRNGGAWYVATRLDEAATAALAARIARAAGVHRAAGRTGGGRDRPPGPVPVRAQPHRRPAEVPTVGARIC